MTDRRVGPLSDWEQKWFVFNGWEPEGPPPVAHYTDQPSWIRYVAWLLGSESLADMPEFISHCEASQAEGKIAEEAAQAWQGKAS